MEFKKFLEKETDTDYPKYKKQYLNYIRNLVWLKGGEELGDIISLTNEKIFEFTKAKISKYLGHETDAQARTYAEFLNGEDGKHDKVINNLIDQILKKESLTYSEFKVNILLENYQNFNFQKRIKESLIEKAQINSVQLEVDTSIKVKSYPLKNKYTIYALCSNKISVEKNHIEILDGINVRSMSEHSPDSYNYQGVHKEYQGKYLNIHFTVDADEYSEVPFFIDYYLEIEPQIGIASDKIINGIRVMRASKIKSKLPYATRFVIFKGIHGKEKYEEFSLFSLSEDKNGSINYDPEVYIKTTSFLKEVNNPLVDKIFEMFKGDELNMLFALENDMPFEREVKYDSLYFHAAKSLGHQLSKMIGDKKEKKSIEEIIKFEKEKKSLIHRIKYCLNKAMLNGLKDTKKIAELEMLFEKGGKFYVSEFDIDKKADLIFPKKDFFYVKSLLEKNRKRKE